MSFDKRLVAAGIALACAAGCARHQAVVPLTPPVRDALAADIDGQVVTVTATPGPGQPPDSVRIFMGRVQLQEAALQVQEGPTNHALPLEQVREIDVHRNGGAGTGLAVGAVGGFVLGAVLALSGGQCPPSRPDQPMIYRCREGGERVLLLGLPLAALGALIGLPIGSAAGNGPVWELRPVR